MQRAARATPPRRCRARSNADRRSSQCDRTESSAHTRARTRRENDQRNHYFSDRTRTPPRSHRQGVPVTTSRCGGIHTARSSLMTDFLTLLRRDHHDLEVGLDELLEAATLAELRSALDGVRL